MRAAQAEQISEPAESVIATIQPSPQYVVGNPSSATAMILNGGGASIPTLSPLGMVIAALLLGAVAVVVLRG